MKFIKKAKYIKYTKAELIRYTNDESSCVQKIHDHEHLSISMAGVQNLRETISRILDRKIGRYDSIRKGIVLDVRNTKVLNTPSQIRHDSADLHLNIESDFYLFKPVIGAVVTGVVKHISQSHIGVIIYRVFNVAVRFAQNQTKNIKINQDIKIRVMKFDLDNHMPEIHGELLKDESEDGDSGISTEEMPGTSRGVKVKQEHDSDERNGDDALFAKPAKRRSILVKHENRRSSMTKHVSFSDTLLSVKMEPDSNDEEQDEKIESDEELNVTPTSKKAKKHKRLKSPSPPPKLDETAFDAFEEQINNDLHSTQINLEPITVKSEPGTSSSSKKRKREVEDEESEQIIVTKKKRKEIKKEIKEEPEESSQETKKKKKTDKTKPKTNSFHSALSSILDEAEMSSSSSTQETPRKKVPKIKKEKL